MRNLEMTRDIATAMLWLAAISGLLGCVQLLRGRNAWAIFLLIIAGGGAFAWLTLFYSIGNPHA